MSIDEWMHATDEERETAHQNWNVHNAEGQEIADHIAHLLTDECVYDILKTRAIIKDDRCAIETFSDNESYDILKKRENINFLGFDIVFSHINQLQYIRVAS